MNSPASHDSRPATGAAETNRLVEHFFRHQSGRLTATLTRALGVRRLELVEDVVQLAFAQALSSWSRRGVPTDPGGWLFRVAKNLALDAIRRDRLFDRARTKVAADIVGNDDWLAGVDAENDFVDDQLRLLVLTCDPALPSESQVAFALKMVGGFSAAEIARALLTTEVNVQKRIVRAKERLREVGIAELDQPALRMRLPMVLNVVYLLFNEGYNATATDRLIRMELCEEALRLGHLLAASSVGRTPATCALLALMAFHAARLEARSTAADAGRVVLLERQDRDQWNTGLIAAGLRWFSESAAGDELSTFHLEAGIAAEHCLAKRFETTNWRRIVELYDALMRLQPTVVHALNRAIAVAYADGPQAGLNALAQVEPSAIPANYYLWDATLGELHRRVGNATKARRHLQRAHELTASSQERRLLGERLAALDDPLNNGLAIR